LRLEPRRPTPAFVFGAAMLVAELLG
jgi:hypothetical protein